VQRLRFQRALLLIFACHAASTSCSPEGHEQQEGDERTPEGRDVLDSTYVRRAFYKSIPISDPHAQDAFSVKARALERIAAGTDE
jgi:murein L,D-transpeptidase YafK